MRPTALSTTAIFWGFTFLMNIYSHPVSATIIRVPADFALIQSAINAAIDGDEVLVADGTYTGFQNRDLDFQGKEIAVRSENGPSACVIDCNGGQWNYHRGFNFHRNETEESILEGFTIKNGYLSSGSVYEGSGAGIYCDQSSPIITNCVVVENTAVYFGGGIYCRYSSPTITDCIVMNNTSNYGSGVTCDYYSSPTIANCVVSNNTAAFLGGGIFTGCHSGPAILNITATENTASDYGGGIAIALGSSPVISDSIFFGNLVPSEDGREIAIFALSSSLDIDYCIVEGGGEDVYIEFSCSLDWGENNLNSDPLFASGPDGDYYLSQTYAGQESDSPGLDAGSDYAANLCYWMLDESGLYRGSCLDERTTRVDGDADAGAVDLGYHYKVPRMQEFLLDESLISRAIVAY